MLDVGAIKLTVLSFQHLTPGDMYQLHDVSTRDVLVTTRAAVANCITSSSTFAEQDYFANNKFVDSA